MTAGANHVSTARTSERRAAAGRPTGRGRVLAGILAAAILVFGACDSGKPAQPRLAAAPQASYGLDALRTLAWMPLTIPLERADGRFEMIMTIAPWRNGFVAAGTTMSFEGGAGGEGGNPGDELRDLVTATFWVSDDGLRWSRVPTADDHRGAFVHQILPLEDRLLAFGTLGVCFPGGCGMLPPNGGTGVWESLDGHAWQRLPPTGLEEVALLSVVAGGGRLVAGGFTADALGKPAPGIESGPTDAASWISADGRTWRATGMPAEPDRLLGLVADGERIIGLAPAVDGYTVWRSGDSGISWNAGERHADILLGALAGHGGDLVVAGGPDAVATITTYRSDGGPRVAGGPPIIGGEGAFEPELLVSTGDALLEGGAGRLLGTEDGELWLSLPVPREWGVSRLVEAAVGQPGIVVEVLPSDFGSSDGSTYWLGRPQQ